LDDHRKIIVILSDATLFIQCDPQTAVRAVWPLILGLDPLLKALCMEDVHAHSLLNLGALLELFEADTARLLRYG
jgi:hypothetical protein